MTTDADRMLSEAALVRMIQRWLSRRPDGEHVSALQARLLEETPRDAAESTRLVRATILLHRHFN